MDFIQVGLEIKGLYDDIEDLTEYKDSLSDYSISDTNRKKISSLIDRLIEDIKCETKEIMKNYDLLEGKINGNNHI